MQRNQQGKTRRGAVNPYQGPIRKELLHLLNRVQNMMGKLAGGPPRARARPLKRHAANTSAPADQGMTNIRTNFEENRIPVFATYEEYRMTALMSLENISIVVDIGGKVVFISQNVLPLLGHRPEDIVGKTLLDIILDKQKDEISQKIILHLPLANAVGNLVEFCCWVRKGHAYQNAQQRHAGRGRYKEKEIYDYVKFSLYIQNSYDESFIPFGKYGPNTRNIRSSAPRLLGEQYYFLVGTVTVLRKQPESEHPTEIQSNVIVIDSDDDSTVEHRRLGKRRQKNELKKSCQHEALNTEHIDSDSEIEIMDIRPPTRQRSLGKTVQTRTSSPLSTSRNISATTSKSTDSGQESMTFSRNMLEPRNIKLEVTAEILLNDNQEEGSRKGEGSDENENKSLEEAKTSNSKDREREQCIYELAQRNEMLRGWYDPPQTGQGQANWACRLQEQMVTAINDLRSGPINSYGNDNSEYPQNQTNRLSEDPVDCTSPLLPHLSASSCQTMTVPHQPLIVPCRPLVTAGYPPAESQYSSIRPQDPPIWSHHAFSDYLRENRQPGQDNSAYFLTEENTINPHP